jgi:hypothetical protein
MPPLAGQAAVAVGEANDCGRSQIPGDEAAKAGALGVQQERSPKLGCIRLGFMVGRLGKGGVIDGDQLVSQSIQFICRQQFNIMRLQFLNQTNRRFTLPAPAGCASKPRARERRERSGK